MERFVACLNAVYNTGDKDCLKEIIDLCGSEDSQLFQLLAKLFSIPPTPDLQPFGGSPYLNKIEILSNSEKIVCLKTIGKEYPTYFHREVFFQSALKFPYVNPIDFVDFEKNKIYTYAQPFGSLYEVTMLGVLSPLFFTDLMGIMYKVGLTIQYYFHRDLIHRDIKPHNIFISDDLEPLLSDFGIARSFDTTNKITPNTGTEYYKSPLVSQQIGNYPKEIDIYSMIITFIFAFSSKQVPYYKYDKNSRKCQFVSDVPFSNFCLLVFTKCFLLHESGVSNVNDFSIEHYILFVKKSYNECISTLQTLRIAESVDDIKKVIEKYNSDNIQTSKADIQLDLLIREAFPDKNEDMYSLINFLCKNDRILYHAVRELAIKNDGLLLNILDGNSKSIFNIIDLEINSKEREMFHKAHFNSYACINKCYKRIEDIKNRLDEIYNSHNQPLFLAKGCQDDFLDKFKNTSQKGSRQYDFPYPLKHNILFPIQKMTSFCTHIIKDQKYIPEQDRLKGVYVNLVMKQKIDDYFYYIAGQYYLKNDYVCAITYNYGSESDFYVGLFPNEEKYTFQINSDDIDQNIKPQEDIKIREVLCADLAVQNDNVRVLVIPKDKPLEAFGFFAAKSHSIPIYFDDIYFGKIVHCNVGEIIQIYVNFSKAISINSFSIYGQRNESVYLEI